MRFLPTGAAGGLGLKQAGQSKSDPGCRAKFAFSFNVTKHLRVRGFWGPMKGRRSSPRNKESGPRRGGAGACLLEPALLVQHD